MSPRLLVATGRTVLAADAASGALREMSSFREAGASRPAALAVSVRPGGAAFCGAEDGGVLRIRPGGAWEAVGLGDRRVTAIAQDRVDPAVVWTGTEPSTMWRSDDGGDGWVELEGLTELESASGWSFPPRPDTHHVRWIAVHPREPGRLWIAIEAGALVTTADRGRSWQDRTPGGPYDTHELAVHADRPDHLRVAAGDGYYQSPDGGRTWSSPMEGFEVGYLRSVAIDPTNPDSVVVSAASHPHAAYRAGRSDGRLYRRDGSGPWTRVRSGWPQPPDTIAPLLVADSPGGGFLAADERGVHRSDDGGRSWRCIATFPEPPEVLRALAVWGDAG